jgi:hypothetical protein
MAKSSAIKTPGRIRLDEANRRVRSRAARLDAIPGAGDVLRDVVAAAMEAALERHEQSLTGAGQGAGANSAFRVPRGENTAG